MKHLIYQQIAPMNIHFVQYPLSFFLDTIEKNELNRIELWGGAPSVSIDTLSFSELEQIRKEIESRGIKIACFTPETCLYPINIASIDRETRERSLRYSLRGLQIAQDLGAPIMQVVSGKGYFNEDSSESWQYARENLSILAERAGVYGIRLTLEPLSPYESNLVNSLEKTRQMLSEINSPHIGVNVDTVPLDITGTPLRDYFDVFKSVINHFHLCDRNERASWIPCGDGCMPIKELLQVIDNNDYSGSLGLEICGAFYYRGPDVSLARALKYLRTCIET